MIDTTRQLTQIPKKTVASTATATPTSAATSVPATTTAVTGNNVATGLSRNPMSQDDYTNGMNNYYRTVYENEYNQRKLAAQQATQQAVQAAESQRGGIQNQYQQGKNNINEQQGQAMANYALAAGAINASKAAMLPQYQQQRNQADVSAAQNTRGLREAQAARGLFNSGSAVGQEAAIQNQASAQKNAATTAENQFRSDSAIRSGQLDMGKAQSLSQFGNRNAELEQARANEIANIEARIALARQQSTDQETALANQLQSQLTAAQIKTPFDYQNYAAQQTGLAMQEAGLTGEYNGQQTLAGQQAALSSDLAIAGVTGDFRGQDTLAAQQLNAAIDQWDQGHELDEAAITGIYNGDPTLAAQILAWQQLQDTAAATGQTFIPGLTTPATTVPGATVGAPVTAGGTQRLTEGGNTYENRNGMVYKNGVAVPPENLKYVPSEIGGTRSTPANTSGSSTPSSSSGTTTTSSPSSGSSNKKPSSGSSSAPTKNPRGDR